MKIFTIFTIFIFIIFLSASVQANENGFGVGIIAGTPTGVTVKKWFDNTTAFDAAVAWSTSDNDKFYLHADYLIHDFDMVQSKDIKGRLALHYGLGGLIELKEEGQGKGNKDDVLAVRVPVGLSYLLVGNPLEFFVEVVPTLEISPDTRLEIKAAIGGRYYF